MALIETINNEYHFWEWLKKSNSYSNNFSLEGAKAVQASMEEYSEETGENIEFDPVAWCVEFSEYESLKDFNDQQGTKFTSWEEVQGETQVVPLDNGGAVVVDY